MTEIIWIKSWLLTREIIADIIAIMLIIRVIMRAHPFAFKRPHETMKLAIPNAINTNPPIVMSNPNSLVEEESMLIKVPTNKGAIPVKRRIIPPSIIRIDIIVIPIGRF